MARTEYISDRNLYYDNRLGIMTLERIVDSAVDDRGDAIRASKYVNAGKPIPREVFEKFGMRHPQEDKDATTDDVEDKSVTPPSESGRRRRVVGSANACTATTKSGRACGNTLPCRHTSHTSPGGSAG